MEKIEKILKEINNENLYKILHLERSADLENIKRNYKKMIKRYHPDKNKEKNTVDIFEKILKAYEILHNVELKALYDSYLDRKEEKSKRIKLFSDRRKKFADDLKKREEDEIINKNIQNKNYSHQNFNQNFRQNDFQSEPIIKIKTFEEKLNISGIKIKWNKNSNFIFTKETIISYFKEFGAIEDIQINENDYEAFVLFLYPQSVNKLMHNLHENINLCQLFKIEKVEKKIIEEMIKNNLNNKKYNEDRTMNIIRNIKIEKNQEFINNLHKDDKNINKINLDMTLEDFEKEAFAKLKLKFKK